MRVAAALGYLFGGMVWLVAVVFPLYIVVAALVDAIF